MLLSIGGQVFSSVGGTGFTSIKSTYQGQYTEQKLVDGAMTVFKGQGLAKRTLSALWVGVDKTAHVNDCLKLIKGHHLISDQSGINLGVWTVDSITIGAEAVFGGGFACHNVTISLSEYR